MKRPSGLIAGAVLALTGCGGANLRETAATLGMAGGALTLSSGVALRVPAGALMLTVPVSPALMRVKLNGLTPLPIENIRFEPLPAANAPPKVMVSPAVTVAVEAAKPIPRFTAPLTVLLPEVVSWTWQLLASVTVQV